MAEPGWVLQSAEAWCACTAAGWTSKASGQGTTVAVVLPLARVVSFGRILQPDLAPSSL
jgi:hypothetical protein